MRQTIEEWAADTTFRGEQFGAYVQPEPILEVYFPIRDDIDRPGSQIDAMLALSPPEAWELEEPIEQEEALRILYAVGVADALHELVESVKVLGMRPLNPHPRSELAMWDLLTDIGDQVAQRLLAEHPR